MLAAWSNTKYTVVLQCFLYTHSTKFTGTTEAYKDVWHELLKVCASNWRASPVSQSPHNFGKETFVFVFFLPTYPRPPNRKFRFLIGYCQLWPTACGFYLPSSHPWILPFSPYDLCIKLKLRLAGESLWSWDSFQTETTQKSSNILS